MRANYRRLALSRHAARSKPFKPDWITALKVVALVVILILGVPFIDWLF